MCVCGAVDRGGFASYSEPPSLVSLSASSRPVLSHLCYSRSVKLLGPVVERLGGRVRCVVGSPSRRSTGAVRAHE